MSYSAPFNLWPNQRTINRQKVIAFVGGRNSSSGGGGGDGGVRFYKNWGYRNKSVNTKFLEQKQFLVNTDKELDAHRGQTLDKTQTQ